MTIFFSQKELDLFNSINEELIEDVIGQTVILYKVNPKLTDISDIYGESNNKVLDYGYEIKALVNYLEPEISTTHIGGISQKRKIEVSIQRKTLVDANIYIEEGDLLKWDNQFFEITKVTEPKIIQGLPEYKYNIIVNATSTYVDTNIERRE